MATEIPRHKKTTAYWDAQAPWQQIWLEHNDYHQETLRFLREKVQPGWRVLDIGAGNGVLALPLQQWGCRVTALEPSQGMRHLLKSEIRRRQTTLEKIDRRRWEEVPVEELWEFDLILASNSLQLSTLGFQAALLKMFAPEPRQVCVITEMGFPEISLVADYGDYRLSSSRQFQVDSSYAYRHLHEAWDHLAHRLGRSPTIREKGEIKRKLVQKNNHFWLKGTSRVEIFWWIRQKENRGIKCSRRTGKSGFY
ncbi:MAG: class I SAM-dependent methyltransferase [Thermodesulfobacteriota bacterium]